MKKSFALTAIILSFTNTFAQDQKQHLENLRQLSRFQEEHIKKMTKQHFKEVGHLDETQQDWEEIAKSEPIRFHLPAGSTVLGAKDDKPHTIPRDIIVLGLQQMDRDDYTYLISQDGNIYYKVHMSYITSMTPELEMFTPPPTFQEYPPLEQRVREAINHEIVLSFHYHQYNAVYTADLFDRRDLSQGSGQRVSADYYFNFDFLFAPGLVIEYEQANLSTTDKLSNADKTSLSIGGALKSDPILSLPLNPKIWTKFTYALSSQVTFYEQQTLIEEQLAQTAAEVGLESDLPLPWNLGTLKWGVSYRRQWLKNRGSRNTRLSGRAAYDDSFGVFIAHSIGWLN